MHQAAEPHHEQTVVTQPQIAQAGTSAETAIQPTAAVSNLSQPAQDDGKIPSPPLEPPPDALADVADGTQADTGDNVQLRSDEPLTNGAVIGNSLSVAIAKMRPLPGAIELTFVFRRIGRATYDEDSDALLVVEDTRGRRAESSIYLWDGGIGKVGSPPYRGPLPVGFTWSDSIIVEMPRDPSLKVQVAGDASRVTIDGTTIPLPAADDAAANFLAFRPPADQFLAAGTKHKLDESTLSIQVGSLTEDAPTEKMPLALSLPITVTNDDSQTRNTEQFVLYVQSNLGSMSKYAATKSQSISPAAAIPVKFELVAAHSEVTRQGARLMLLYHDRGLGSGKFCGFIPVPGNVKNSIDNWSNTAPIGLSGTWRCEWEWYEFGRKRSNYEDYLMRDDGTKLTVSIKSATRWLTVFDGEFNPRNNATQIPIAVNGKPTPKHFDGSVTIQFFHEKEPRELKSRLILTGTKPVERWEFQLDNYPIFSVATGKKVSTAYKKVTLQRVTASTTSNSR